MMRATDRRIVSAALAMAVVGGMAASIAAQQPTEHTPVVTPPDPDAMLLNAQVDGIAAFRQRNPDSDVLTYNGRVSRVYGAPFAHGTTPSESAQSFLERDAIILGAQPEHFQPGNRAGLERALLMYDEASDAYRFTAVYKQHVIDGFPVHDSYATVLVRNVPGYPAVLVVNGVQPVLDFQPAIPADYAPQQGVTQAARLVQAMDEFTEPQAIIYASDGTPRMAYMFEGSGFDPFTDEQRHERFIFDAETNRLVKRENLIMHADIFGQLNGYATPGLWPDTSSNPPTIQGIPHNYILTSGGDAITDQSGGFVLHTFQPGTYTLISSMLGPYANVTNQAGGGNLSLSVPAQSPGSVILWHNLLPSELTTAQVNGFLHTNIVRDYTVAHNPSYPWMNHQLSVNVNINTNCNAHFSSENGIPSINFRTSGPHHSGGTCPNTAYSTIVYHEFGHYLIWGAGTSQGAYGEGMSDAISIIVTDDPHLAQDLHGSGTGPLRSGINDVWHPCNGPIHYCGQVLSGSVWQIRQRLAFTSPDTHRETLSALVINSILLNPPGIGHGLVIDFMVLDSPNGSFCNVPHFAEIRDGFGQHHLYSPLHHSADLNGDCVINGADLGILLSNWGDCSWCDYCPGDINNDCQVNGADLGILLSNWQ